MAGQGQGGAGVPVDLPIFREIAAKMEEHITTGVSRPRIPTAEQIQRQVGIQFPQRPGGPESWPGLEPEDYNLNELDEPPPLIRLSQRRNRILLSAARKVPGFFGLVDETFPPGTLPPGTLKMTEERTRMPESYSRRQFYLSRPERGRILVPSDDEQHVKNALQMYSQYLHQFDCVFLQPLGWGGQGLAALFEHTRLDGSTHQFVAKAHFTHMNGAINSPLSDEAGVMREFLGSAHTVQPLDPRGFVLSGSNQTLPGQGDRQHVIVMEHCARGTFDNILRRTARGDARDPRQALDDYTLWSLFECLFRSVVALRYPQRYWNDWLGAVQNRNQYNNNPVRDEEIPRFSTARRAWRGYGHDPANRKDWVNFDMDPQNYLVGDFTAATATASAHSVTPVLKMSDFGMVINLEGPRYRGARWVPVNQRAWRYRDIGKLPWSTPEKFSTEWLYCRPRFRGGMGNTQVAGQYGWKMHLYSIGLIMWSLLTHRQQPHAPVPWKIRVRFAPDLNRPVPVYPDDNPPAAPPHPKKRKARAGDPWTKSKRRRVNVEPPAENRNNTLGEYEEFQWSYGGYLLQHEEDPAFSGVDRELRELVVRCLMELPRDRPELEEMDEIFRRKLGRNPPGGSSPGGSPPGGQSPGSTSSGGSSSGGTRSSWGSAPSAYYASSTENENESPRAGQRTGSSPRDDDELDDDEPDDTNEEPSSGHRRTERPSVETPSPVSPLPPTPPSRSPPGPRSSSYESVNSFYSDSIAGPSPVVPRPRTPPPRTSPPRTPPRHSPAAQYSDSYESVNSFYSDSIAGPSPVATPPDGDTTETDPDATETDPGSTESDGSDAPGGLPPIAVGQPRSAFAARVFRDPPPPVHFEPVALDAWLNIQGTHADESYDLFSDPDDHPGLSDREWYYSTLPTDGG